MSHPTSPLLQAAALPFRFRNGQLELCLITSISKGRWGIPKGIIDPGETPEQEEDAAARQDTENTAQALGLDAEPHPGGQDQRGAQRDRPDKV